ncbi:hypothetical protein BDV96DRAFT_317286 [Lophiotrema nucula]|uniref:Uncharacterized protein n=1 Tax=Lophiotrema nucula TaxID=690887 RepID=A0A6A5ZLX8_9PLEO|nr:hypothetical protein BDV96DRAFT_317286 [Lophiotrema nucula]
MQQPHMTYALKLTLRDCGALDTQLGFLTVIGFICVKSDEPFSERSAGELCCRTREVCVILRPCVTGSVHMLNTAQTKMYSGSGKCPDLFIDAPRTSSVHPQWCPPYPLGTRTQLSSLHRKLVQNASQGSPNTHFILITTVRQHFPSIRHIVPQNFEKYSFV